VSLHLPKTAHLTNFFHPSSGGISAFYRALLAHANRTGREMRLIVPGEQSGVECVGAFGKIYWVRAPQSPLIDSRYRILLPIGSSGREIRLILGAEQPEILEVSDKYTMPFVSGMLRKRLIPGVCRPTEIATSHERLDDNIDVHFRAGALGKIIAGLYMRYIYFAQFDHHVANSHYTAGELEPASKGHTTRRGIWVCPMGVDTELFRPADRTGCPGTRLLYAGRLAREKNIALLLEVLRALPQEFSLDVIGDGPERESFSQRAQVEFGDRVRMRGHIHDRTAYAGLLRAADVFVHPNPREPFGIGPLEAMACGIPVVLPNAGGVLAYASDQSAWLCAPTADAFAAAIRSALACRQERDNKCREGRAVAERHDWLIVSKRYFDLIDTLYLDGFAGVVTRPLGAAVDAWARARRSIRVPVPRRAGFSAATPPSAAR